MIKKFQEDTALLLVDVQKGVNDTNYYGGTNEYAGAGCLRFIPAPKGPIIRPLHQQLRQPPQLG